jgi:hypothetical protein
MFKFFNFLTGQIKLPHCDGCRERGPDTLRVFSNWELTLVIIPSPEMYDKRHNIWVTPCLSIRKRLMVQLP